MATVTAELHEGMQVTISDGRHTWTADEPEDKGGTDSGPDPYELLLGSLAACTCITVSLYCKRKGWKLASVSARLQHDRVHADDCENCDDELSGYLERVTSHIEVEGELDDGQRTRLQEVAARCPVHKTLANGVTLQDELAVR
ncbi:MAG: OsmC family protein [Actinomycetota bacterium]|nr:OsmC family protein [Actinomycetota bacterium]